MLWSDPVLLYTQSLNAAAFCCWCCWTRNFRLFNQKRIILFKLHTIIYKWIGKMSCCIHNCVDTAFKHHILYNVADIAEIGFCRWKPAPGLYNQIWMVCRGTLHNFCMYKQFVQTKFASSVLSLSLTSETYINNQSILDIICIRNFLLKTYKLILTIHMKYSF